MLQVVANRNELSPFAPPYKATGGNTMAHGTDTKVHLIKKRGSTFTARIAGSSRLPDTDAAFAISSGGIINAP